MINKSAKISVRRQCALLSLNRSGLDYQPLGPSQDDIDVMREIDKEYMRHPFYGGRKMVIALARLGRLVNRKRVQRLMRLMGIEAIAPGPNTSKPRKEDAKYPYLLRGLTIDRPNQVWASDITYIPLRHGFAYLVAIIDWYSRFVLSWCLSNTIDSSFCIDALNEAIERFGRPDIFNSDQGSQFTADAFSKRLIDNQIAISRDGRGRYLDNIFVERLWRSVKYEDVYLNGYQEMPEARAGIGGYMAFFNDERPHQALGNCTPREIYTGAKLVAAA